MTRTPSTRPDASEPLSSASTLPRCGWANGNAAMIAYHDTEWGTPLHDDRRLFELLTLEGAQAGLSWRTILDRREEYRRAFHGFDIARVAAMKDAELEKLLRSSGIIRNRMKVFSTRSNARVALAAIGEHGSLDAYLWSFVEGKPVVNRWQTADQVPASTEASDRMSKALRKAGFGFVGSTICYAFMQATGMVDDHLASCFRTKLQPSGGKANHAPP